MNLVTAGKAPPHHLSTSPSSPSLQVFFLSPVSIPPKVSVHSLSESPVLLPYESLSPL